MNKSAVNLAFGLLISAAVSSAYASSITSNATADNSFVEYLSTSATSIFSATNINSGSNWAVANSSTATITGPEYLIIQVTNAGGPGGLLGSFHLSDGSFAFGNGLQDISTGGSGWNMFVGSLANPASPIVTEGANGVSPWGTFSTIDSAAQWVWNYNSISPSWGSDTQTIYFETAIVSTRSTSSTVPEPTSLALLAIGLLGFVGSRKKAIQA